MINFACFLTLLRIALAPVIVTLILKNQFNLAFFVFLGAVLTDVLDGFVARRYNQQSRLGQILDPVADKILFLSVICSVILSHTINQLVFWIFIFLLSKELILLLGGSILWFGYKKFIQPSFLSRAVSFCEVVFIFWVFMFNSEIWLYPSMYHATIFIGLINITLTFWLLLRYVRIIRLN